LRHRLDCINRECLDEEIGMLKFNFVKSVCDQQLKFAVIIARYKGKWVLCKHRERDTLEFPGGHREENETIEDTARRELYEESGAIKYILHEVGAYSIVGFDGVVNNKKENFGMLFTAEIKEFDRIPEGFEIERIEFYDDLTKIDWTYPEIQNARKGESQWLM
jgi:8-oxo-dGTP diphosphatase